MSRTIRAVLAGLFAACFACAEAEPPGSPEQPPALVVFVCERGNVKSLMAASYFNELASKRDLPFRSVSRGVAPDSTTVPPLIARALRSEGFDVADFHPTAITAPEISAAARVITIGAALPAATGAESPKFEQWDDVPPASTNYPASSESLKTHVSDLLERLSPDHGEQRPTRR